MTSAVYAGSFDPPTNGHMHVIKTAAKMFDRLRVLVATNPNKDDGTFDQVTRMEMLLTEIRAAKLHNVDVLSSNGRFVARDAADLRCQFLVRGIRTASDLEAETALARINAIAAPDVETIILLSPQHLADVSSSTVRGLVGLLGWQSVVRKLVPPATMLALEIRRAYELADRGVTQLLTNAQTVIDRYLEPGRHYHSLGHIVACQEWVLQLTRINPNDVDLGHVSNALWFHDAVYDAKATDNEAKSAALVTFIGYADVHRCRDLIMATARHFDDTFQPTDMSTQFVMDIDLASFADPPDEQERISRAIRAEYAHVPEEAYRTGRAKLLEGLLKRPRIYRTDFFHDVCEAKARANISAELERLREHKP